MLRRELREAEERVFGLSAEMKDARSGNQRCRLMEITVPAVAESNGPKTARKALQEGKVPGLRDYLSASKS